MLVSATACSNSWAKESRQVAASPASAFIASQPAFASSVSKVSAICARGRPWLLPPLLQPQTRLMRHRIPRPEQTLLQGQPSCCYCCKSCGLLTRLGSPAENGDALKSSHSFCAASRARRCSPLSKLLLLLPLRLLPADPLQFRK